MRNPTAEAAGYFDREEEDIDPRQYYKKWVNNARKARLSRSLQATERSWPDFSREDQLFALERAGWWRERMLREKRWQELMTQASAMN